MADDKGGGGYEWGTLEIVLGILLVIGVLDRLSGAISSPKTNTSPDLQETVSVDSSSECGLSVSSPTPFQTVTGAVEVKGVAGTCNWRSYRGTALYAQLVDSAGVPVSLYTRIPSLESREEGNESVFRSTITLSSTPKKGTGYLILIPAQSLSSEKTISHRIPVRFR